MTDVSPPLPELFYPGYDTTLSLDKRSNDKPGMRQRGSSPTEMVCHDAKVLHEGGLVILGGHDLTQVIGKNQMCVDHLQSLPQFPLSRIRNLP